ncbi:MAG: formate dehydrogenase subunit alpha [Desulfovermiculus sp.]|nr:formate dehydrogenase subunit alpha [Desulfovermiculus sp.]
MPKEPSLSMNGRNMVFQEGETILQVAERNHVHIPVLCHMHGLVPTATCRICVVEDEKAGTLVTACSTPAREGMIVATESKRVVSSRKMTLRLLLASGNHDCLLCPANGECTLQDLAYRYQVPATAFSRQVPPYALEAVNPFILRDFAKCILCGRCVRACQEIQVNQAISIGFRGKLSKIVAAGDRPLKDSDCVFCGECVQVCPTGALLPKDARFRARPWEEQRVRTTCPYCGVGCQMYLHVKDNTIQRVTGVEEAQPNAGSLCVKGRFGFGYVHSPERLTTPLIKENGEFREASWEEALQACAHGLLQVKDKNGPDSIGVLSSAKMTNEENYLLQKFTRTVLGTNNIDHCARLCHSSTVAGLGQIFGSGAMTNSIADIPQAEVILITGSNTTESHPVLSTKIKQAITRKGTKLIIVDPRRIPLVGFAHTWLRQNLGTDIAWINGMMHVILEEDLFDHRFVDQRTQGLEDLRRIVSSYTPEYVYQLTGIEPEALRSAARLYAQAKAASIIYTMGITQHVCGTDNVKSLANLAMLCGHMGIEGGGVNPLRGQNNVQGACDMGALPNVYSGYQPVTDQAARSKMEQAWGVSSLPAQEGLKVTQMIPKVLQSEMRAMYIVGENPALSDPDSGHVHQALADLDFLVVQDIFLTETARYAQVVLPACTFAEKGGTFTNTERRVQRVRPAIPPLGNSLPDSEIILALAARMGATWEYEGPEQVMREIATVTSQYAGIDYSRLKDEGLHWPCCSPDDPGTPILHCEQFTCGLGQFQPQEFTSPAEVPDEEYPMWLTTGRILYQYHTGTMTRKSKGLNSLAPECLVEMSPKDAQNYDLQDQDQVRVISRRGAIQAKVKISLAAVPGTVFIPFHYAEAAANVLTNPQSDPVSGIPEFKACAVQLSRI